MALVHRAATALVILLGVVHVAMAPVFFDEFAMRVMWYVAQGLLAIVIGLFNLSTSRASWRDRTAAVLCHLANGIGVTFVALYSIVDPTAPSYVGIVLFVLMFLSAITLDRRRSGLGGTQRSQRSEST